MFFGHLPSFMISELILGGVSVVLPEDLARAVNRKL